MKTSTHIVAVILIAMGVAACSPTPTPTASPTPTSAGDSVNVAQETGIAGTQRIEVYQATAYGSYLRTVIDSSGLVAQAVEALDAPTQLVERVRCPAGYDVHFVQDGGSRAVLGLVCDDAPDRIRGAQPFWGTMDGQLPSALSKLVLNAVSAAPALQDLASDRVVHEVVSELVAAHPNLAPYSAYDWRRVDLQPPGLLGASHYLYVSTDWVVDVSWPIIPNPEYKVEASVPSVGFAWSGTHN